MIVALTISKYRTAAIPFAFLGMAFLRIPLWLNKRCTFWKLMGAGKDASVDQAPNFKHWAILTNWENRADADEFQEKSIVMKWFRRFSSESFTILLRPLSANGLWSGKQPFISDKNKSSDSDRIAVFTRASIHFSKTLEFQKNIKRAANAMRTADGFVLSAGIGEAPFFRQATFSVWKNAASMKNYAYKTFDHSDVIKLTRERKWYSEELFARFAIIESKGTLNGQCLTH